MSNKLQWQQDNFSWSIPTEPLIPSSTSSVQRPSFSPEQEQRLVELTERIKRMTEEMATPRYTLRTVDWSNVKTPFSLEDDWWSGSWPTKEVKEQAYWRLYGGKPPGPKVKEPLPPEWGEESL